MKRLLSPASALLLVVPLSAAQRGGKVFAGPEAYAPEKVQFRAPDKIKIAAELYRSELGESAPVLLYFHDAHSSRDEFRRTARRLRREGYNGLAVDLRAGNTANGPKSVTAQNAQTRTKNTSILDAEVDVVRAFEWAKRKFPASRLVGIGCSSAGGLLLHVAATRPELIDGAALFSPAEVFDSVGASKTFLQETAAGVRCPVFFTSARAEESEWRPILAAVPEGLATAFLPERDGVHGVRALENKQPVSEEVWPALRAFLGRVAPLPAAEPDGAVDPAAPEDEASDTEGGSLATGLQEASAATRRAAPAAREAAPAPSALTRVVALGASMTDGIGLPLHLSDVFSAMIRVDHAPIENGGSTYFFLDPGKAGPAMIERALAQDPTLVVAVDFLFWFGYGSAGVNGEPIEGPADRVALLEHGLALLDRLPCPILVGDFPDMQDAVGKMLMPAQMPSPAGLEALNERLADWSGERDRVILVPLAHFAREMQAGRAVTIGNARFPEGSTERLLQWDHLHPTLEGLTAIVDWLGLALVEHGVAREQELVLPFDALYQRVRAATPSAAPSSPLKKPRLATSLLQRAARARTPGPGRDPTG